MDPWNFSYYARFSPYLEIDAERLRRGLHDCSLFKEVPESSPENYIWNRRGGLTRCVLCQDGPQLFEALWTALYMYHGAGFIAELTPDELQRRTRMALDHVSFMCQTFLSLRKTRALSKDARSKARGTRADKLIQAKNRLTKVVKSLAYDDYAFYKKQIKDLRTPQLVDQMRQAFADYGPPDFEPQDVNYALSIILGHFGIEQGGTDKVTERLRGRARDRKHPKK
jgi:hypothetical protein